MVWIFDLDNTLYPADCNLFAQVDQKMGEFISRMLGVPFVYARHLQKTYYRQFGTTLTGLMQVHRMDPKPFLDYVHDLDLSVVKEHPELAAAIGNLPGRKLIFTNSSRVHAQRVMERIGITKYFEEIFDISDADYIPKPDHASYAAMLRRHEVSPETACMIDDIPVNLETANALGMATVWLRGERDWGTFAMRDAICKKIDFVADDLCEWLDLVLARRGT